MQSPQVDFFLEYVELLVAEGRLDRLEFMIECCDAILVGDFKALNELRADSRARYKARFGREAPYLREVKR